MGEDEVVDEFFDSFELAGASFDGQLLEVQVVVLDANVACCGSHVTLLVKIQI